MKKIKVILSKAMIFMTIFFAVFGSVGFISSVEAAAIPKPVIAGLNPSYMVGDRINLRLTSIGATKLVQYRGVLTNTATKKTMELLNGYTPKYYNPKYSYPLSFTVSEPGQYTLSITSKLGGYKTSSGKTIVKTFIVKSNATTIDSIDTINAKANLDDSYTLPLTVNARMKDGSITQQNVVWDNKNVDTSKLGTQTFYGSVSGYDQKVTLVLNVVDEKILSIDPVTAEINEGSNYTFPVKVNAKLKNSTQEVDVKWNAGTLNTDKPGTYTFQGTVEGYNGNVGLTVTVKPVDMSIASVSATNLKEIVLVFNKKINADTVINDNFRIYRGINIIPTNAALMDDEKTVKLSVLASGSSFENNAAYTMVIEGLEDINGKKMDTISKDVVPKDSEIPMVTGVSVIDPSKIMIEFSEPVKNTNTSFVTLKSGNGNIGINSGFSGYDTNSIYITPQTNLQPNAEYSITISGFQDFAGNLNTLTTKQFTCIKDVNPIKAEIQYIDQYYAIVGFNKPVKGISKELFYDTTPGKSPIGIFSNPQMTLAVSSNDTVDKVWVKFYDKNLSLGHPLLEDSKNLVILSKSNIYQIHDGWGNFFLGASLPISISADKKAPAVTDLESDSEESLIIAFDEEVVFNALNAEILDKDGAKILGFTVTDLGDNKYRINLGKSYIGNTLTVNIKNVQDKAITPNVLESYSKSVGITDKTPPQVVKVVKKIIPGLDQSLYVYFNEPVDSSAVSLANYYLQNTATNIMKPLTEAPSFSSGNTIVRLPLSDEEKTLINSGYNLFIKDVSDLSKNLLPGRIIPNADITAYDSADNKPRVIKLEAVNKNTLVVTFNQLLKRVDIGAFLLNTAAPSSMDTSTDSDGNTVVTLTTAPGKEFASDLSGLALLNIIPTTTNRIDNEFGLGADNSYYTNSTPTKIQDEIPPAVKVVNGVPQIKTYLNSAGIIDSISVEYEENIDSTKLSALSYAVDGRSIARVYTNSTGIKGQSSAGRFVVIELKIDGTASNTALRPGITQILDVYDMNNNKLSPGGAVLYPIDNMGSTVLTRLSSQIGVGQTKTISFSKPLSDICKIIVQNTIISASRGKGSLVFNWSGNNLIITNINSTYATDFYLVSPINVTLTDLNGNTTYNNVLIGY